MCIEELATDFYEIVMDCKRIKGEKEGKKYDFLAYYGYDSKGRRCNFKLTKACSVKPEAEGKYIVIVEKCDINKDKKSRYNDYWIRSICKFKEYDPDNNNNFGGLPV